MTRAVAAGVDARGGGPAAVVLNIMVYESKHALALAEHGHQEVAGAWVLLQQE